MRLAGAALLMALATGIACRKAGPAPAPDAGPDITVTTPRLDLGRTVPGGWVEGAIGVRAGASGAELTQVAPSCGCTVSKTRVPRTLAPGEEIEAPLAMDLSRLTDRGAPASGPRVIERDVAVASRAGTRVDVPVFVTVTDRMTLEPPQVALPTVPPGRPAVAETALRGAGGLEAPQVTHVTGLPEGLTAEAGDDPDGSRRLRWTWRPEAAGDLEALASVHTSDPSDPVVRVRVTGRCALPVTVSPERIEDLQAPVTRPVVARLTLRRVDDQPMQILGASAGDHRIDVRIDEGDGPTRTLQVIVPIPPPPREVQTEVTVRTDVPGAEVLRIPVHVRGAR